MAAKRYAVLDADGVVVNHILIDDPMPQGYWPGYGATLVPLEPISPSDGAALDVVEFSSMDIIPQIGDTLNLQTGEVTRFIPQLITVTDDTGNDVQVASAPETELKQDVVPMAEGRWFKPIGIDMVEAVVVDEKPVDSGKT